jgi:macrolide transport system ATP-binding/permease protein
MNSMTRMLRKLRLLAGRERFRRELEEEMIFHRGETEKEFLAQGVSADEAQFAARR